VASPPSAARWTVASLPCEPRCARAMPKSWARRERFMKMWSRAWPWSRKAAVARVSSAA